MARPKKERVICAHPKHRIFGSSKESTSKPLCLQVDEYEVLRLHDLEHLSQSEIAEQMLISRPAVTQLLVDAHEKLADALVNGKAIEIIDGSCRLCEIGAACPKEKKSCCAKRHRCRASCRHEQNRQS